MSHPILYLDRSTVRPGIEAELRDAVARLVAFVSDEEPQLLAYEVAIDETSHSMVVAAVHPDSASLERHLSIGGDEFRRVGRYIDLRSIEVVGPVSARAIEQLEEKAAALGEAATIEITQVVAGFSRLT
jgi:quinol monooxygenase YgiN